MDKNTEYRHLTDEEIELLTANGNFAEDWEGVMTCGTLCCQNVRNNSFYGQVFLGTVGDKWFHDGALRLPEGIVGSMLRDCTVGDHCAIHNVHCLSNVEVGNGCLLFNIDEMTYMPEKVQYMAVMNECGGRSILSYSGMTIGDAYLWAKYRDRKVLMQRLEEMTRKALGSEEGRLGTVGDGCVIKNCLTICNVAVRSSLEDPTYITDSVVLTDGVVGYGCKVEHGVMAERFLLGEHVTLERGARLYDTVVGDNSTIACCEVGSSLIFPAHQQHHNNSFLIAALVMGQSNIAAGSTIGSNHNGRTADNELVAGRGFWPGLCSSFKHSSRFASYTLLAKGAYPGELDIRLPFALVNNNASKDCLEVMPAYWWMYNMYALDRNRRKFAARDQRKYKQQHIVTDPLAPDTAEEILDAIALLKNDCDMGSGMEKGRRKCMILKAEEGKKAYSDMLTYYAMGVLTETDTQLPQPVQGNRERHWTNLGGQLVAKKDMEQLMADIESGRLKSWAEVHDRYDELWKAYGERCREHAYLTLCEMEGIGEIGQNRWQELLVRYEAIKQYVADQVRITREKDDINPFRQMTYDSPEEMHAVLDD